MEGKCKEYQQGFKSLRDLLRKIKKDIERDVQKLGWRKQDFLLYRLKFLLLFGQDIKEFFPLYRMNLWFEKSLNSSFLTRRDWPDKSD